MINRHNRWLVAFHVISDAMLGVTAFIRYLASLDGLAPGITEQHAADLCWALMDAHLYRLLVAERGWTAADFTQWLSGSLAATVLRTPCK